MVKKNSEPPHPDDVGPDGNLLPPDIRLSRMASRGERRQQQLTDWASTGDPSSKPPPVSRAGLRDFSVRQPLLCEACSAGCIGHGRTGVMRCDHIACECTKKRPSSCAALERRWEALRTSGKLDEDATIIATAMRTAADAYIGFAQAETSSDRTREQFLLQAAQCITIAEAIEP